MLKLKIRFARISLKILCDIRSVKYEMHEITMQFTNVRPFSSHFINFASKTYYAEQTFVIFLNGEILLR